MSRNRYAELEIRILARHDRGYPIEITCEGSEFPRGYGSPALLPWMPGPSQQADGERLFRWLLTDDTLQQAWAEARGRSPQRRIRLRIDVDAAELHSVPWELLCDASPGHATQMLAADANTPFSRYLALSQSTPPPLTKRPIRVLAVIANPDDLRDVGVAPIDVAGERRIVLSALTQRWTRNVRVDFLEGPATLERVEAELKAGYDVLYIAAHGAVVDGKPWLLMAGAANRVAPLADDELAGMLARQAHPVRLVFLAACQSAAHSTADAVRGFGPRLVEAGVPAVVGMQDAVPEAAAQKFAAVFFRQLLRHGWVDLAANEARSALLAAQMAQGWGCPVLYSRVRDGRLIGPAPRWRMAVAVAAALLIVLSGVLAYGWTQDWFVAPMPQGFGIAVAPFVAIDGKQQGCGKAADRVSELLFNSLYAEATLHNKEFPTQVRGPAEVRAVVGVDAQARDQVAAERAKRHGARVLIYGVVVAAGPTGCEVEPAFYVAPGEGFEYGSEVTGATRLGKPVPVALPISDLSMSRENLPLARRAEALKQLLVGLSNYYYQHYEEAASKFQRADAAQFGQDGAGKEVVQLLLGAARLRMFDLASAENEKELALEQANNAFAQSLKANPQYARAYLGLASVLLGQARFGEPPADVVRLQHALDLFAASRSAADRPESAHVLVKADLGSAQVHLAGFADGLPGWSDKEASRLLQRVIDAYDAKPDEELRWLAGESHRNLGWLAMRREQREQWLQAETHFRAAIDLLDPLPDANTCKQVAQSWEQLALVEARLGRLDDARRDFDLALNEGRKCFEPAILNEWGSEFDAAIHGDLPGSEPLPAGLR
jgi:tetratricopeptide (TPR) repeat protein